jgi:hypothetical protein
MPAPVTVAEPALLPLALAPAYERTIVASLPDVFAQRHLALPAVAEVTDQKGEWGSQGVGSSRTIHLADGGILTETLTILEPPHRFGYRIDVRKGPMKPLVHHVDGLWAFREVTPVATEVTWSWELTPRSILTAPLVRCLALMWPGYAAKALVRLETLTASA